MVFFSMKWFFLARKWYFLISEIHPKWYFLARNGIFYGPKWYFLTSSRLFLIPGPGAGFFYLSLGSEEIFFKNACFF